MEESKKRIVSPDKDEIVSPDNDNKERIMVVDKLPVQPVREIEENGVKYNLITVEEYLTELANK